VGRGERERGRGEGEREERGEKDTMHIAVHVLANASHVLANALHIAFNIKPITVVLGVQDLLMADDTVCSVTSSASLSNTLVKYK
jgi:hypothetical protein